jgi:fumarylacetoacetase
LGEGAGGEGGREEGNLKTMTNKTNDPALKSWIQVKKGSDFPIQNLPFGIFRAPGRPPAGATRIGDSVIDLFALAKRCFLGSTRIDPEVFNRPVLNDFIALGKPVWSSVRESLSDLFSEENQLLHEYVETSEEILYPAGAVEMLMPVHVGDYTDFYSSQKHATNLGTMFRDAAHALNPNWKHLPVGYSGRTSSIVISGTPIHRPKGQTKAESASSPEFGPTSQLDFELEVAFVAGKSTLLGESVSTSEAEDHIFGLVLFNDLSARDIQKWEYAPLGPFLGKNFGSVVSPWIITLDALEPFRIAGPEQQPAVLPYLAFKGNHHFDINLEVSIQPEGQKELRVCKTNYKNIYWNMVQQLAHHTVNGCNINVGDLYSSGTISGPDQGSYGSMMELTWQGTRPIQLPDGSERKFIEDFDTIVLRGYAEKKGLRIGFGEALTKILPAK